MKRPAAFAVLFLAVGATSALAQGTPAAAPIEGATSGFPWNR